ELRRNARRRALATVRAAPAAGGRTGTRLSRALHPALFDGDVSSRDTVRRGATARGRGAAPARRAGSALRLPAAAARRALVRAFPARDGRPVVAGTAFAIM